MNIKEEPEFEQVGLIAINEKGATIYLVGMEGKIVEVSGSMAHWMCYWDELYVRRKPN